MSGDNLVKDESYLTRREWILRYSSPLKSFLFMAGPMILIMLVNALYGIVDKQLTLNFAIGEVTRKLMTNVEDFKNNGLGHIWSPNVSGLNSSLLAGSNTISEEEFAKQVINVSTQYSNTVITLVQAISLFTSVGTSIRFGHAMGSRNKEQMNNIIISGFIQTLILIILATIVLWFLAPFIITSQAGINYSDRMKSIQYQMAYDYTSMFVAGIGLITFASFISTLLRTEGKVWAVININVIGVILNIGFGILFMEKMNLGMKGAVYGSMVAWSFMIISGILVVVFSKDSYIRPNFKKFKFTLNDATKIWYVGLSPLLTNMIFAIVSYTSTILITHIHSVPNAPTEDLLKKFMFIYADGNLDAPEERISATIRIMSSTFPWLSIIYAPIIGASQGANVNYAYNAGSLKRKRIKEIFKIQVILTYCWLIIAEISVISLSEQMIRAFSGPGEYHWWFVLYMWPVIFGGFTFATMSLFQGIGNPKISLILSIARSLFFQILFITMGFFMARAMSSDGSKDWIFFLMNGLQEIPSFILSFTVLLIYYKKYKKQGLIVDVEEEKERISYKQALVNEYKIKSNFNVNFYENKFNKKIEKVKNDSEKVKQLNEEKKSLIEKSVDKFNKKIEKINV